MAKTSKKTAKKIGKKRKSTVKAVKKSTTKKGNKVTKVIHESTKEIKVEKALVDNFIALQKVMVNLSLKFDNLTTQISKLLELFDISAKALAKKEFETEKESRDTHMVMQRLDNIAQQAGLIGKGLALIHEVNTERSDETDKKIKEIQEPKMSPPPMQIKQRPMTMQKPMLPSQMHSQSNQLPQQQIQKQNPSPAPNLQKTQPNQNFNEKKMP